MLITPPPVSISPSAGTAPLTNTTAEIQQTIIKKIKDDPWETENRPAAPTPEEYRRAARRALAKLQIVSKGFEAQVEGVLNTDPPFRAECATHAIKHQLALVKPEGWFGFFWGHVKRAAIIPTEADRSQYALTRRLEKEQSFSLNFSSFSSTQNSVAIGALQALSQNPDKNDLKMVSISFFGDKEQLAPPPDIITNGGACQVLSCLAPLSRHNPGLDIRLDLRQFFNLDLSENHIEGTTDERMDALYKTLEGGANVTYLDASMNDLYLFLKNRWAEPGDTKLITEPMKKFFKALTFSKNLAYLDLSQNRLTVLGRHPMTSEKLRELANELGDSIGELKNLKTLRLRNNGLIVDRSYRGFLLVIPRKLLENTKSLTKLDIGDNAIRDSADLASIVREAPNCLEELDVSDNDCTFQGRDDPTLHELARFTALKSLKLGRNKFQDGFIPCLTDILPRFKQLSHLNLGSYPLSGGNAQRLASCLLELTALTELTLCIESRDAAGEQALLQASAERLELRLALSKSNE